MALRNLLDGVRRPCRWEYVLVGAMAFVVACSGRRPADLAPTFSSIQSNVFDVRCAVEACHRGRTPESQLNLERGRSYRSLVNVRSVGMRDLFRVRPGLPDSSYLISKLEGGAIVGDPMPRASDPLPDSVISVVRKWIENGARED